MIQRVSFIHNLQSFLFALKKEVIKIHNLMTILNESRINLELRFLIQKLLKN